MNRLQQELRRLYLPDATGADTDAPGLVDGGARVRAMALALARPADWSAVSRVWQGVQADLALPAPAIAVNGRDGYQLWFSIAEPVPAAQAAALLETLRLRYLGDLPPGRVALMPSLDGSPTASALPARQVASGQWSAFVAPDLAPMFADEPWLDLPPNLDGQARLLSTLASMPLADFQRLLAPPAPPSPSLEQRPAPTTTGGAGQDPRAFLLAVMNDASVALALRIEAAKALLPGTDTPHRG